MYGGKQITGNNSRKPDKFLEKLLVVLHTKVCFEKDKNPCTYTL